MIKNEHVEKRDLKIFIFLFFISFLYILPIILSNRYYIDDIGRALHGYTHWKRDGRPLADVVMQILNFGKPILDLSPITQILSIFSLSVSLTLYSKKYFKNGSVFSIAMGLFLFIGNPFFIQSLSFKYDSFTMSLSLCALIICFYFETLNLYTWLYGLFLIISSFSLYQASIGLFFILSVVEISHKKISSSNLDADTFSCLFFRLTQFFLGYFLYSLVVLKVCKLSDYGGAHSQVISFDRNGIDILIKNIESYFHVFKNFLSGVPAGIYLLYSFIILIFIVKYLRFGNFYSSSIVILSPFLCFLFSFIHLSILRDPVFQERVLLSFCGFMIFVYFCVYNIFREYSVYALSPLVCFCFFLSYSYGNASTAQNRIDTLIASSISYDQAHYNGKFKTLSIVGLMPQAKQREIIVARLPIMKDLVPIYMNNSLFWGGELLNSFLVIGEPVNADKNDFDFMIKNKPFLSSRYYDLYANKSKMIINFKQ